MSTIGPCQLLPLKSSFLRADVLAACIRYGPQLQGPAGLDPVRLMAALSFNESSIGANCGPRHEPVFDVGGAYGDGPIMRPLLDEYGSAAACSYGPWQMMLCNYGRAYTPSQLLTDLQANAEEFVRFFNLNVLKHRGAKTLNDVGQVWNSGHIVSAPSPGVSAYCQRLQEAYSIGYAITPATTTSVPNPV